MNLNLLYSTIDALNYLGAICNNTSLLDDKRNRLNPIKDFELNRMHKILYGAVENIYMSKDTNEIDSVAIDMYLSAYPDQHGFYTQQNGNELVETIKQNASNISFMNTLSTIKKLTLLREYEKVGFGTKDIYNTNLIDPTEISEERKKFDGLTELDIRNAVKAKLDLIHENMQIDTGDMYSFHGGDDIFELIKRCQEEPTWGHPFQSLLFNRAFRGMLGGKVMIRSGSTGSGKSRQMIGDMCNISATKMYDINTHEWVVNPRPVSSTMITTELDKTECQLIMLATISKIPEDIIKDGIYTPEVAERLDIAAKIIEESKMNFEFSSNFSISDLESMIEKNINRHETGFVFFDYIQITPRFAQELRKVFGYDLREDQMLNLLVSSLKNIAAKFNIFILTATQLNRSHKQDEYPDATHLRGGQATADKADYGVITMRVTQKDKEKLERLMATSDKFNCQMPTHGHHVFKNRGGKYTGVIIWVYMDLDNMVINDCFITTQDFEQLYAEPKIL